ncbi:MAG: hypothetical protein EOP85_03625 [Verrucomicrobiaceae bacterium]|nr:MAG: hypothetical protein EOP85_03625 [Verrucomicrobiaceae bacterium]
MFKAIISLMLSGFLAVPVAGFVAATPFPEKVAKADVIARGVVVKIIQLTTDITDSRGPSSEEVTDKGFSGPNAIALFRVTETLKGKLEPNQSVVFVPCGYSFDESPSELTDTKEYVLFLKDLTRNYYHPTTSYSIHRVQDGRVCISGFDWDENFKPENIEKETEPVGKFIQKIKAAMVATK